MTGKQVTTQEKWRPKMIYYDVYKMTNIINLIMH